MPSLNSQERQDEPLVIGVTGRIGAGKTSVAKHLSAAHGFWYVRYSQVLSEWLAEDPDGKSRLQAVGWEVMAGGMQSELNSRLIAQIPPRTDCAVDGLRHPIDFESLAKCFAPRFLLLYIDCPPEIRWEHLRSRYPKIEDFNRADSHPVEQRIETLRDRASIVIGNNRSLEDLYRDVDDLLNKVQQGDLS